jgi:hypothetical protein
MEQLRVRLSTVGSKTTSNPLGTSRVSSLKTNKKNYFNVLSKDASFLHTTILTMCTAKKANLKLEAKGTLEM